MPLLSAKHRKSTALHVPSVAAMTDLSSYLMSPRTRARTCPRTHSAGSASGGEQQRCCFSKKNTSAMEDRDPTGIQAKESPVLERQGQRQHPVQLCQP